MTQAVSRAPVKRVLPSPMVVIFVLMLAVTIGAIAWAAAALSDPAALPIAKVSVEGEFTHLDPKVLKIAVVDAVNAGFFGVDVEDIRQRLLDEPWIRDATIRRVWPDTLHVRIVEQTPAARWGAQAMLNEQGDIFAPRIEDIPPNLVRLDGPLGTEIEVLREYRYLADELRRATLSIAAINVSARYAWTISTRDGKEIVLGRSDHRRRLQRFLFAYERGLEEAWTQIGRIDLRYTNGFAVGEVAAHTGNG